MHKEAKSCLKIYHITASRFPLDFLLLQVVYQFMHNDVKMQCIFSRSNYRSIVLLGFNSALNNSIKE